MADTERQDAYDRTVDLLTGSLEPVGRVWPFGRQVAVWAVAATALVVGSTVATPRPDLAAYLARPVAVVEVALLAAIFLGCGVLALRGVVPGGEPGVGSGAIVGGGVVLVAALGLLGPLDHTVSIEQFIARGVPCLLMTLGLAGLAALVPLVAAARGFPLAPAATGAMAGIAGAVTAVLAMRLHCPVDETSHQLTFHAFALLPLAATGAAVLWGWRRLKDT